MRTNADITIELRDFIFEGYCIIKVFCKIKGNVYKLTIAKNIAKYLSQYFNSCGFSLLCSPVIEQKGSKCLMEVFWRNDKSDFETPNIEPRIRIILKSNQQKMTDDIDYIIKQRLAKLSKNV